MENFRYQGVFQSLMTNLQLNFSKKRWRIQHDRHVFQVVIQFGNFYYQVLSGIWAAPHPGVPAMAVRVCRSVRSVVKRRGRCRCFVAVEPGVGFVEKFRSAFGRVRVGAGQCGSVRRPNHCAEVRDSSGWFRVSSGRFVIRITLCKFGSVWVGLGSVRFVVQITLCNFGSVRVGLGSVRVSSSPEGRKWEAPIRRRSAQHLLEISKVGALTSSPRDDEARVSQGHLKLTPGPCRRPTMGAPIRRRSTRHLPGEQSSCLIPTSWWNLSST